MRRIVGRLVVSGTLLVPLLACISAFLAVTRQADSAAPAANTIRGKCGMCHTAIAQEWLNSLHAKAFQDTRFIEEAKHEKDAEGKCFTCHAPQAVRAKGLGQTPGFRTDLRDVGVDCMVCHVDLKGKVHAPYRSGESAHEVEPDPQHKTEALCASCHEAFGTVSEFKQTSFAKQGQTCATCHMPKVKRPVAEGGSEKMVASHIWRGGSDPAMLKKAVTFESSVKPDGTVIVNVTDAGAGHKFPTGIHFREADVLVTVTDASGKEVFSKREVFADKSKSGGTDTRINPGETRTITVATGVTSGSFTSQLLYKSMPSTTDQEATVVASNSTKL
jgi:Cytochrome c554 and c-prime